MDMPVTSSARVTCRDASWPLSQLTLAGMSWSSPAAAVPSRPLVLLHGWLDNCLSFTRLAPELASLGPVHAIDMAGHGHSGHRSPGQSYWLMDYVSDLAELLEHPLCPGADDRVDLVGHSLGGIVAGLYAAAFPERVRRLVMIDSLGAISRPLEDTVPQLRRAIGKRLRGSGRAVVYPDITTAAKAREGGVSPLSHEAALTLVPRNLKPVERGFVWRTDPRLRHPSPLMMTEDQVRATLAAITTPTLLVQAANGLLASRGQLVERAGLIRDLSVIEVPGGHHCHLDGDTAPVARAVSRFLEQP
jgi:pimeloyl-ACP methyl ester carboxylesterase